VVDATAAPRALGGADGEPLAERPTLGPATAFEPLAQSLLECGHGRSQPRRTGDCDEVLFVISGHGTLHVGGAGHALEPESGAHLAPGEEYALEATSAEGLTAIAVRIPPRALDGSAAGAAAAGAAAGGGGRPVVRRLADQEAHAATTDRQFRIVADPSTGLASATHFVGYIPTVRAPEHFHTYDEVIYILEGEGVLHADGTSRRLTAGSCIQLPARTVHCLENTGDEMMRVVAVFRPAGSPATAYYPDGTPAYADAPRLVGS
jgi:mannose-6-phosphate isomerase-like protein (cupin superfamily)